MSSYPIDRRVKHASKNAFKADKIPVDSTYFDVSTGDILPKNTTTFINNEAGTINDGKLNSTITKQGNTFNGASQLVKMDSDAKLPPLDGSNLINVVATATNVDTRPSTKCKYLKSFVSGTDSDNMAFIMDDGTIKGCGLGSGASYDNGYDEINAFRPQGIPVDNINPPATKFVNVVKGWYSSYALTSDGDVYSWGSGGNGCLGHGNTQDQSYAKRIQYFYTNGIKIRKIVSIRNALGSTVRSVFFITTDNMLYACGGNSWGNLGLGHTTHVSTPTRVGTFTNVLDVVISGGYGTSSYLVLSDGRLYTCGYNAYGQLGLGNATQQNNFIDTGLSGIIKVCAETTWSSGSVDGYAIALKSNGTIYVCGHGGLGALGMGNTTQYTTWTLNPNVSNATDIITGGADGPITGVIMNGSLYMCGYNANGQLGRNNTSQQNSFGLPDAVNGDCGFQTKIVKVIVTGYNGYSAVIILDTDGYVYGAGYNSYGQLGRVSNTTPNSTFQKYFNVKMPFETRKAIDIAASGHLNNTTVYVLYNDGLVRSCGNNYAGQCGIGETWLVVSTLRDVIF